jgi:hypothetical protein
MTDYILAHHFVAGHKNKYTLAQLEFNERSVNFQLYVGLFFRLACLREATPTCEQALTVECHCSLHAPEAAARCLSTSWWLAAAMDMLAATAVPSATFTGVDRLEAHSFVRARKGQSGVVTSRQLMFVYVC